MLSLQLTLAFLQGTQLKQQPLQCTITETTYHATGGQHLDLRSADIVNSWCVGFWNSYKKKKITQLVFKVWSLNFSWQVKHPGWLAIAAWNKFVEAKTLKKFSMLQSISNVKSFEASVSTKGKKNSCTQYLNWQNKCIWKFFWSLYQKTTFPTAPF